MSRLSLDSMLGIDREMYYCYEEDHWHGDLVTARQLEAESMACDVGSTSRGHRMCVVHIVMQPNPSQASDRCSRARTGRAFQ